jgi:hypothetical protein
MIDIRIIDIGPVLRSVLFGNDTTQESFRVIDHWQNNRAATVQRMTQHTLHKETYRLSNIQRSKQRFLVLRFDNSGDC